MPIPPIPFTSYRAAVRHGLAAILCCAAAAAPAQQTTIPDYDTARDQHFWAKLYLFGGWTLYCGAPFAAPGRGLQVEHVYPRSWIARQLPCGTSSACEGDPAFDHAAADLHNLFPTMTWANSRRSNNAFGELSDEDHYFEDCDFEVGIRARDGATIVEPREKARGEIARAMFHMHTEYRLPVDIPLLEMLKEWNRSDPPSWDEKRRNNKIEDIQGTRNAYIDDPALAESL